MNVSLMLIPNWPRSSSCIKCHDTDAFFPPTEKELKGDMIDLGETIYQCPNCGRVYTGLDFIFEVKGRYSQNSLNGKEVAEPLTAS